MIIADAKIAEILSSDYSRLVQYELAKKYDLSLDESSLVFQAVQSIVTGQSSLDVLLTTIASKIHFDAEKTKGLVKDIVGMYIMPIAPLAGLDGAKVSAYLLSLGGEAKNYQRFIDNWPRALEEEKEGTYDNDAYLYENEPAMPVMPAVDEDNPDDYEDDLTTEEEFLRMQEFFKQGLVGALSLQPGELANEINEDLIDILTEKEVYRPVLEKSLTESRELIGKEKIVIGERESEPTCANWFKDFFAVSGVDSIDTVKIAKYIIESPNAKRLPKKDQEILRRLLLLYFNIKFFPAPFSEIPIDQWQVLPIAREAYSEPPLVDVSAPKINSIPRATSRPAPSRLTVPKPAPARPINEELVNLKNILLQYPPS